MSSKISLTFLGGSSSIGASCAVLEVGATRLLIDCGVRLNGPNPLPDFSQLNGKSLDAILLTHAHFDHCGALPIIADFFGAAPIIASPPTVDLATILLRDAVKLMNSPDQEKDIPLFTAAQVDNCLARFIPLAHGQSKTIGDLIITLLASSHILGASMVHVQTPAGNVLFTGDYSVEAQRTVPALTKPSMHVDLLVSESTYGNRLHEDRKAAENRLVEQVKSIIEKEGKVLIPAFAIGRAQEVLLILKRALRAQDLPALPVYVDGMVRSVCTVYGSYPTYLTGTLAHDIAHSEHPFYTNGIVPVASPEDRNKILAGGSCVIVASSGMLTGGASALYAAKLAVDERNGILITGYQDEESPGRALLDLSEAADKREIRVNGQSIDVRCIVQKYGLSAHADRMEMIGLIESQRPRTVVLVHGDKESRESLAKGLTCRDVITPLEGITITRSFQFRENNVTKEDTITISEPLDIQRARGILGPAGEIPIAAWKIALAWFGKKTTSSTIDALVSALENAKLVRRDDKRRSMLWVLSPQESGLFPDEAALEESLKKENPKGVLLEWCMRMKMPMPHTIFSIESQWHVAEIRLSQGALSAQSGLCKASSRKTAEQLAAKEVLKKLALIDDELLAVVVDEQCAEEQKAHNAKGRLLEMCACRKIEAPFFIDRPTVNGYAVKAVIKMPDQEISSAWYRATSVKTAQQAASADILDKITIQNPADENAANSFENPYNDSLSNEQPIDFRPALNNLRQQGIINDFGYMVKERKGPDHKPSFMMVGWATDSSGKKYESGQVRVESKKDGALFCSNGLWNVLKENGLVSV